MLLFLFNVVVALFIFSLIPLAVFLVVDSRGKILWAVPLWFAASWWNIVRGISRSITQRRSS